MTLSSWGTRALGLVLAVAAALGLLAWHDAGVATRAVAHAAAHAADSTAHVWADTVRVADQRAAAFRRERDSLDAAHVQDSLTNARLARLVRIQSPTVVLVDTSDRHPGASPMPPLRVVVPPELTQALAAKDQRIADLEQAVAVRDSVMAVDSVRASALRRFNASLAKELAAYQQMARPRLGFKTGAVVGASLALLGVWAVRHVSLRRAGQVDGRVVVAEAR